MLGTSLQNPSHCVAAAPNWRLNWVERLSLSVSSSGVVISMCALPQNLTQGLPSSSKPSSVPHCRCVAAPPPTAPFDRLTVWSSTA